MDEILELYQSNVKLTTYTAKRWLNGTPDIIHEDILAEACIGLWRACKTFDNSKGFAFSTYAVRVISNQIGQFMRQQKKYLNMTSLDSSLEDSKDITLYNALGYEPDFLNEINYSFLLKKLDKYPYLKLFVTGKTQPQIADMINRSQAQVSRRISKERKMLKEEIKFLAG